MNRRILMKIDETDAAMIANLAGDNNIEKVK